MIEKITDVLNKNFSHIIQCMEQRNKNEIYIEVLSGNTAEICEFIYSNIDCSLGSIFANDERSINGLFSIYYVFAIKKAGFLLVLRAKLSNDRLEISSISGNITAAGLYEREIKDMFGISFTGHPDDRELVFHENWPDDCHPLKKDFYVSCQPDWVQKKQDFVNVTGTGVFEISVGPVHAGVIEPGHFRFSVAGEPIINLEAKLYYVHKGIEKLAENQSFEKVLFLSERISGDETVSNSMAYCQALEKIALAGAIPKRAEYTRTILGEMERIYNHLADISGICVDVAYGFPASQFAMIRRWCLVVNEEVTGSRFLRSSIRPGGVRKDFIRGWERHILAHLRKLEKEFNETVAIIKSNSLFIDRVENTGVLKSEIAIDLNAVGPGGRASGVCSDVRRDFPYAAYDRLTFEIPEHNNGDVNCRMNVKIEEVNQSIGIIKQAIEKMPAEGMICENIHQLEPYKFAFGMTESPRGENIHWVMTGENNTLYRYKVRTPSFCNWPALCHAVKGNIVPDFPLINKSFNLSYSGNDL